MTMKTGQGDDPFGDDPDESAETAVETDPETEQPQTKSDDSEQDTDDGEQFPYVVRRQRVKDERTNELVAFCRDEYAEMEDDVLTAVANELDMREKDVSVLDLREAFIELAIEHPEDVAEILEGWGYEHLK